MASQKKSILGIALGVVAGCFLLVGVASVAVWLGLHFLSSTLDSEGRLLVDQPAPAITTTTLDGQPWRLADQRGKVVVLDFWATWCGPCIVALPRLSEVYQRHSHRDDFVLAGVSLDHDRGALVRGLEQHAVGWLQLYEDGGGWKNNVARAFDVRAIPHLVVIDKAGTVRAVEPSGDELLRLLDELLAVPTSS